MSKVRRTKKKCERSEDDYEGLGEDKIRKDEVTLENKREIRLDDCQPVKVGCSLHH